MTANVALRYNKKHKASNFKGLLLTALIAVLSAVGCAHAATVSGKVKYPNGVSFNGTVVLTPAVPGQDTGALAVVLPQPVTLKVLAGAVIGCPGSPCSVTGNDVMQPSSYYTGDFYDTTGKLVMSNAFVVTGSTFDIGQAVPTPITTANVSYQDLLGMRFFGFRSGSIAQYIDFALTTQPANPPSNYGRAYFDSATGRLTCINSSGSQCFTIPSGVTGTGTGDRVARWEPSGGGTVTNNVSFHGDGVNMTVTVISTSGLTTGDTVTVGMTNFCTSGGTYLPLFAGTHGPITVASGTTYTYAETAFNGPTYNAVGPAFTGCGTPTNTTGTSSIGGGGGGASTTLANASCSDDGVGLTCPIVNQTRNVAAIADCSTSGGSNPCVDASEQVTECVYQLTNGAARGGICDATGFGDTTQAWSTPVTLGKIGGSAGTLYNISSITNTVGGGGEIYGAIVTATPNPFTTGQSFTISGVSCDSHWNGSFTVRIVTNSTHFDFDTGGTIPRTTCGAGGTVVAGVVSNDAIGVTLRLSNATKYNVTYAGGGVALALTAKSSVEVAGSGLTLGNAGTFTLASTANVKSVIGMADPTRQTAHVKIRNVTIAGHFSATVTNALLDLQNVTDNSAFENITLFNCPTHGLLIHDGPGVATGTYVVNNLTSNCGGGAPAGAIPIEIKHETGGDGVGSIEFAGATVVNRAGSGQPLVFINGNGVDQAILNIAFHMLYGEPGYAGADVLRITDAGSIHVYSVECGSGPASPENCVHVTESTPGFDAGIVLQDVRCQAPCAASIKDDVNGDTFTIGLINYWALRGKINGYNDVILPYLTLKGWTFAEMNAWNAPDGTGVYCTDCDVACAGGASTGRTCFREGGTWTH